MRNSESHLQHDELAAHGKRQIEQTGSKFNLVERMKQKQIFSLIYKNKIKKKKLSTEHKRSTVLLYIQLHKSCLIVRKAKNIELIKETENKFGISNK